MRRRRNPSNKTLLLAGGAVGAFLLWRWLSKPIVLPAPFIDHLPGLMPFPDATVPASVASAVTSQ